MGHHATKKILIINSIILPLCLLSQGCAKRGFSSSQQEVTASSTIPASASNPSPTPASTRAPAAAQPILTQSIVTVSSSASTTLSPIIPSTQIIQSVTTSTLPQSLACANGALDVPVCQSCAENYHMENGRCTYFSRACVAQPAGSYGGQQIWNASSGWSSCQNFSCSPDYFADPASNSCVKGCRAEQLRWFVQGIGHPMNACVSMSQNLRDGESARLLSHKSAPDTQGWYTGEGYVDVTCVNSKLKYPSGQFMTGDTAPSFEAYLNSLFRRDPLHIECNSGTANFSPGRSWESCKTASTANCTAALGSQPTVTNACWAINIYMDAGYVGPTSIGNLAMLFDTSYKVFLKTSKDGFSTKYDITDSIASGFGKPLTNEGAPGYGQPYNSQGQGEPAGFSIVARKDMEGQAFKVVVQVTTHLAGIVRQQNEYESLIQVRENASCPANYDGSGVANFVVGSGVDGKLIHTGYPFPLNYN